MTRATSISPAYIPTPSPTSQAVKPNEGSYPPSEHECENTGWANQKCDSHPYFSINLNPFNAEYSEFPGLGTRSTRMVEAGLGWKDSRGWSAGITLNSSRVKGDLPAPLDIGGTPISISEQDFSNNA